jgi:hypothetical protein
MRDAPGHADRGAAAVPDLLEIPETRPTIAVPVETRSAAGAAVEDERAGGCSGSVIGTGDRTMTCSMSPGAVRVAASAAAPPPMLAPSTATRGHAVPVKVAHRREHVLEKRVGLRAPRGASIAAGVGGKHLVPAAGEPRGEGHPARLVERGAVREHHGIRAARGVEVGPPRCPRPPSGTTPPVDGDGLLHATEPVMTALRSAIAVVSR